MRERGWKECGSSVLRTSRLCGGLRCTRAASHLATHGPTCWLETDGLGKPVGLRRQPAAAFRDALLACGAKPTFLGRVLCQELSEVPWIVTKIVARLGAHISPADEIALITYATEFMWVGTGRAERSGKDKDMRCREHARTVQMSPGTGWGKSVVRARAARMRGFTLVELMIVVAIIGILAALALYGVRKYLSNAKTAEARNALGNLGKVANAAYEMEGMNSGVLLLGSSTGRLHRLCGSASNLIPAATSSIKGRKYQSSPTEWDTSDRDTGWTCLKFTMEAPQYYVYEYVASGTSEIGSYFTGYAHGDLDGDGIMSQFELSATIKSEGNISILSLDPAISELRPDD